MAIATLGAKFSIKDGIADLRHNQNGIGWTGNFPFFCTDLVFQETRFEQGETSNLLNKVIPELWLWHPKWQLPMGGTCSSLVHV